jgi:hypothetical protein
MVLSFIKFINSTFKGKPFQHFNPLTSWAITKSKKLKAKVVTYSTKLTKSFKPKKFPLGLKEKQSDLRLEAEVQRWIRNPSIFVVPFS